INHPKSPMAVMSRVSSPGVYTPRCSNQSAQRATHCSGFLEPRGSNELRRRCGRRGCMTVPPPSGSMHHDVLIGDVDGVVSGSRVGNTARRTGGPGEIRTHTGMDLNHVPLPVGLRARSAKDTGYRSDSYGVVGATATWFVDYCDDPAYAPTCTCTSRLGGLVARDPDDIERDIEKAWDNLAATVDQLTVRADPKKLADTAKTTVLAKLEEPKIKYSVLGGSALVGLLLLRKLLR